MAQRTALITEIQNAAFEKIQRDYGHLPYHNLSHTEFVVNAAQKLAKDRKLPKSEQELLVLAAAAHDVVLDADSLTRDYDAKNERASGEWLTTRMAKHPEAFSDEDRCRASLIIEATTVKHRKEGLNQSALPGHALSELLCDADLAALGSPWDIYEEKMRAYFNEIHPNGTPLDWRDYLKLQVSILREHHYYTEEAQKRFHHLKENAARVETLLGYPRCSQKHF